MSRTRRMIWLGGVSPNVRLWTNPSGRFAGPAHPCAVLVGYRCVMFTCNRPSWPVSKNETRQSFFTAPFALKCPRAVSSVATAAVQERDSSLCVVVILIQPPGAPFAGASASRFSLSFAPISFQYMPPMDPAGDATGWCFSGICEITASVVNRSDAIDAAFCRAERTTFVGSITPAWTRFS